MASLLGTGSVEGSQGIGRGALGAGAGRVPEILEFDRGCSVGSDTFSSLDVDVLLFLRRRPSTVLFLDNLRENLPSSFFSSLAPKPSLNLGCVAVSVMAQAGVT